jgi:hypothetical protein
MHALLGTILVMWGRRGMRRRSRSGLSVFIAAEVGSATAAYEQKCDNSGNDADEESFVMRHPVTCCGVAA